MQDFIDAEEFPFTEDEVYRAERLFASEADARDIAATIASGGRENRASHLAAAAALARGSRDPAEVNYPVLLISAEFFAQLAALSPELEARVERHRAANRDERRVRRVRNTAYRLGMPVDQDPPAPEVLAAMAAEDAAADTAWADLRVAVANALKARDASRVT